MTTTQAALLEALREALSDADKAIVDVSFKLSIVDPDACRLVDALNRIRAALRAAEAAQPEPFCWANPVIALPDDEDEAHGWTARVSKTRDAVFSMPLYAAPPQPAPIAAQAELVAAEQHFAFAPNELRHMRGNPYVLAQLMDYHDQDRAQAESMLEPDELGPWPSARFTALYERGRSIMAEDLDVWPDDLRKQFGFPVAAQAGESPWLRAIDEAMVVHHLGTAEPTDDYETAKRKLSSLLAHAQSIGEYFAAQAGPAQAPLTADQESRSMFVARLENMQEQGDKWLTVPAVLALLNDCDFLASRSDQAPASTRPADASISGQRVDAWQRLYFRAIKEAMGLTNYIEEHELRLAKENIAAIEAEARALAAAPQAPAEQPADEDGADMPLDHAMHLAECWAAGKLIGGDGSGAAVALLAEVRRLNAVAPAEPAAQAVDYLFTTAKQKGLRASDGELCPNDHDPDCRWPQCMCRAVAAKTEGDHGAT